MKLDGTVPARGPPVKTAPRCQHTNFQNAPTCPHTAVVNERFIFTSLNPTRAASPKSTTSPPPTGAFEDEETRRTSSSPSQRHRRRRLDPRPRQSSLTGKTTARLRSWRTRYRASRSELSPKRSVTTLLYVLQKPEKAWQMTTPPPPLSRHLLC